MMPVGMIFMVVKMMCKNKKRRNDAWLHAKPVEGATLAWRNKN